MSDDRDFLSADGPLMKRLQAVLDQATTRVNEQMGHAAPDAKPAASQAAAARPAPPARIMVVDNHVLVREALVNLIDAQPDMRVVRQAGSLHEAVATVQQAAPDLVVIEFTLPDGDGAQAARQLLAGRPETRVVILTAHDDDDCLFAAVTAGAVGYLLKSITTADLLDRLRGVMRGEVALSPRLGQLLLAQAAHSGAPRPAQLPAAEQLTARELEILGLLVQGHTNRQIADVLKLSVRTVEYHRANLTSKLGLQSRAALIHYAMERGLSSAAGEGPTRAMV